jgi:hypothetical protein
MSVSNQHYRVALVSVDDHALIWEILNPVPEGIVFKKPQDRIGQAQDVLLQVAQYTEPADLVQMVCNHPIQIIQLQKEITK